MWSRRQGSKVSNRTYTGYKKLQKATKKYTQTLEPQKIRRILESEKSRKKK